MGSTPDAAFKNPSFLMLTDGDDRFAITLLSGGVFRSSGYTNRALNNPDVLLLPFIQTDRRQNYQYFSDSNQLISSWFGQNDSNANLIQELDIVTFGIMYKGTDLSFALNHRLRGLSSAQLSRGWYEVVFFNHEQDFSLQRNLSQYSFFRHEIGLGFAWEQGLLSGLIGNRSAIYVGINPKLILPVEYFDATYQSESKYRNPDNTRVHRTQTMSLKGSGNSCAGVTENPLICSSKFPNWSAISGMGAGFDAGITWRYSLGDGIRLRNDLRPVSNYQISLTLAVNDIGFVSHLKSPFIEVDTQEESIQKNELISINQEYNFTATSFFDFVRSNSNLSAEPAHLSTKTITYLTPSTLSAGIGLELNKVKLAMEYHQQSGNHHPARDFSSLHVGNQIQLIPYVSLRSGFIVQSNDPIIYTAGIGLETNWLSISASTMAKQFQTNDTFRPVMMNIGALTLRF